MDEPIRLPDPLVMEDGRPVSDPGMWMGERREELLELFRSHVYGRNPVDKPGDLAWTVEIADDHALSGKAVYKKVRITFSGPGGKGGITLHLTVPKGLAQPAPTMLLISNRLVPPGPGGEVWSEFWPVEDIVDRGYAGALFYNSDLDPDDHDDFRNGVHGIFDGERTEESWGTIAAWAWGASRVMDYLETDGDVDAGRVAVIGHSRGGKTSLWAGAQDQRFAMVVSNESGCTGASVSRLTRGERISNITEVFPHWFCGKYKTYSDREKDLPVDQHELLALIAPRLLYVASAAEDAWADPLAEFTGCKEASKVYGFLGFDGISGEMPAVDTPRTSGKVGYHVRSGWHDLTEYDWNRFMDFADANMTEARISHP